MSARVLVVDNYDSFVFNLVQYLYQLGAECEVVRNDEVSLAHAQDGFDGVLLSPGPGTPEKAGVCVDMVRHCADTGVPVFGVCLGMQSMAVAYGGVVGRAPELLHGKTSLVTHEGAGVFSGLPSPFTATRYHSLAVERGTVPDALEITAWTETGIAMGLRHRELRVEGCPVPPRVGPHRMGPPH
ncbi:anthranilate synthase component II, partial [Streptomyces himastatinicus ATCC 53653]